MDRTVNRRQNYAQKTQVRSETFGSAFLSVCSLEENKGSAQAEYPREQLKLSARSIEIAERICYA